MEQLLIGIVNDVIDEKLQRLAERIANRQVGPASWPVLGRPPSAAGPARRPVLLRKRKET
jgi:hypothetical protein